jgi:AraC family transcriptional regulator, regulatory protein of adaptative response / methylated-DNA-[protein]-cysteine methyltransferase
MRSADISLPMSDYERIEKVIRHLDRHFVSQPSLKELAKLAGLSEFHFQRLFRRWTGTTPKSFLKMLTASHAKAQLRKSRDLLSVSLDSGLSGPGRLHDLMVSLEAVSPGEFKAKGQGVEIRYGFHPTPFGNCLIGLTDRGVCHLAFLNGTEAAALKELKSLWPRATFVLTRRETGRMVKRIFGKSEKRGVPVLLRGTPFQLKVWEALLRIPEGAVISYEDLARFSGRPGAARAVGTAVGKNAVAFLIPCHRVIRETGAFGQYRWGEERKRAVLTWEYAKSEAREEGKKE